MYSVVGSDGQTYGPVNPADLQNWINEGRINASTEVIDAVTGDRKTLRDISMTTGLTFPVATPPAAAAPAASAPVMQRPSDQYSGFSPQQTYTRQIQNTASPKSKALAAILAFFLGGLGIHRFYLGHTQTAIIMLLTPFIAGLLMGIAAFVFPPLAMVGIALVPIVWIWQLVDFIMILTGGLTDVSGRPLS